jgi:hypothetical protein
MNTDKYGKAGYFIIVLLIMAITTFAQSGAEERKERQPNSQTTLYLFWGRGCPHCEEEKVFLKTLKESNPHLVLKDYEVWYDRENAELFARIMKAVGRQQVAVPATVLGKKIFVGFTEATARGIEQAVAACLEQGCPDAIAAMTAAQKPQEEQGTVKVPLLGDVDPATISLPLFTVMLGALDSFNPCAFFVLLFLLSMLIHARSRKKMFLIGGIFVFFSGFIYFLYMAAWLTIFLVIGKLAVITATAGVIALFVGLINIKDFFIFKRGLSLMLPEKAKPKLFERMRDLLRSSSLPAMIAGTVVLSVSANAYELLCTAGFPMVYTRTLTLHNLPVSQYYLYLVLYTVVYVIPLAVIVLIMTISLGSRKLTEWQGRQLKLISGLMMFFLGLVLLLDPALLNNAAASAVLLAVVLVISCITVFAARKLRPDIAAERSQGKGLLDTD